MFSNKMGRKRCVSWCERPVLIHVQYSSHVFHILQVDFCLLKYVDHRQLTTYYLTTKMAESCPLFLNVVREKEKGCQKIGRF